MPMNRKLYPANWGEIATAIKEAADWKCVECGKECRRTGESPLDFLSRVQIARFSECPIVAEFVEHPQRFTLTVSHTDHNPANCAPSNLRALCAPCHCRYDLQPSSMAIKRKLKAERLGQLSLLP